MNESAEINLLIAKYHQHLTYEDNKTPLKFMVDEFILNLTKKRLKDFLHAIDDGCTFQPVEVTALDGIFKKTARSADLNISELYEMQKYLLSLQNMSESLNDRSEYEVKELFLDLVSYPQMEMKLAKALTPEFGIASEASSTLASIRRTIIRLQDSMDSIAKKAQKSYEPYLADSNIAFRNGYSTIAVLSSNKNKVAGVVATTSASGLTSYIIPNEVLSLSSKIAEARDKEQEEIRRIIHELSLNIGQIAEPLQKVYPTALLIDRLFGAVLFGKTYRGSIADMGEKIWLKDVAHPLLDLKKVIYNDLKLNLDDGKILLISGPNAGGKTVLLKSVQIAALLNQAGLFVPASAACLPIFDRVFFLSGDNQSVLDNLSTFSSHISELKTIAEEMTGNSLVIIDEIGQGTSPLEGSALGVALIKKAQSVGSYLILTSHYEDLKDYCLENKEIMSAKMVFDEEKMVPTFRINYGVAGHSFGLAVAKKMGLPADIIQAAENFVEFKRSEPLKHNLDLLNKRLAEAEDEKSKLVNQGAELERLIVQRQQVLNKLYERQVYLREKEDEIIEEAVEERLRQIDLIWKKNRGLTSFAEVSKAKGELRKSLATGLWRDEQQPAKLQDLAIGDAVRITLTGQTGIIKEKRGRRYKIDAQGLTVSVDGENLELIPKPATKKLKPTHPIDRIFIAHPNVTMELNIIGQHYNEADSNIRQYLDSCIVARYHRVRIVHGVGTGVLQKLTWKILGSSKNVESYSFGGEGEGGVGSTVVYFK